MQTFVVNEFISLELDGRGTQIVVNGEYFHQCKYLLISIPTEEIDEWEHFDSMDEVIRATEKGKGEQHARGLTPEEAFWGHCSNLQAWADSGYDYRILDTKLSIPIIMSIMKGLLNNKDKEGFKKFVHEAIESLDDYIINSLSNEATYGKFNFLYRLLFRTKDRYFTDEEISGSIALKQLYDRWLPKKLKEKQRATFLRWERKLWGSRKIDLFYRKLLRRIRDHDEKELTSDEMGYLPYLYSTGKFEKCGSIDVYYANGSTLVIRDEKGHYWKRQKQNGWN